MEEERRQLKLPAFAFVEGYGEDDELEGRNVIIHVRSMSLIEIIPYDPRNDLNKDVLKIGFTYHNRFGFSEKYDAALHVCTTLDAKSDVNLIKNEVLKPAVKWFCDYMDWEDKRQHSF